MSFNTLDLNASGFIRLSYDDIEAENRAYQKPDFKYVMINAGFQKRVASTVYYPEPIFFLVDGVLFNMTTGYLVLPCKSGIEVVNNPTKNHEVIFPVEEADYDLRPAIIVKFYKENPLPEYKINKV